MVTTKPVFPNQPAAIETARLRLRPIEAADLDAFHAMRNDPVIFVNFKSKAPDATTEETRSWMERFMPPQNSCTFLFAVEERSKPGVAIGVLGSHHYPTMGYFLRSDVAGRGYATEALRGWLEEYWHLERVDDTRREGEEEYVEAQTLLGNLASQRVLSKCGFTRVGQDVDEDTGEKLFVFRMTRSDGVRL